MTWRIKVISGAPAGMPFAIAASATVASSGQRTGRAEPRAPRLRYVFDRVFVDAQAAARPCLQATPVMDLAVLRAGGGAEREGYHAVCVESVTDDGVLALRDVLNIPVIGAGSAALHLACLLGDRITILTPSPRWLHLYDELLEHQQLRPRLASVRHVDLHTAAQPPPDATGAGPGGRSWASARTNPYLAAVEHTCRRAISADGAEVIVLGATTMRDEHRHLAARLPVPVIEPAAAAIETAALLLDLGPPPNPHPGSRPDMPSSSGVSPSPAPFRSQG
jgi:allantoin racemase